MNGTHTVFVYNYVCPTCGLTIGPYDYDHKVIECGNGCGNLLQPVFQYAYLTAAEREPLDTKVVRKGTWKKD
jgi:hypothetical protein